MGGNKNSSKRSGNSTAHAGKHRENTVGRNANPLDRRVIIGKGKGQVTALPGKELKAAASKMMSQVMKRRSNAEKHIPGMSNINNNNNNNKNNRTNFRNNNNNDNNQQEQEEYDDANPNANASSLRQATALAVEARSRQAYHQATQQSLEESRRFKDQQEGINTQNEFRDRSLKKFFKNLKDVIDQSDVVLQVIDARDPIGCRLKSVEDMIESEFGGRKKVVLVVNKIDLLPSHHTPTRHYNNNTENNNNNQDERMKVPMVEWLRYFRESEDIRIAEVCPFTCNQNKTMSSGLDEDNDNRNAEGLGGDLSSINQDWCVSNLYSILRRLATVDTGARKNINVGVIGYPNVGKSSVINALRGKNVVGVGNMPGFTTGLTQVDLRKDIKIIDCPGVVMPGEDMADIVLRNAAKVEKLNDPLLVVARLLARCDPVALAAYYDVPIPPMTASHQSHDEDQRNHAVMTAVSTFLKDVAFRRGRGIKQNGSIDEEEAARLVLKDWNDSRIHYYSLPPERSNRFFTFSGVTGQGIRNNGADNQQQTMLSTFSEGASIFGQTDLPRFFIQLPKGEAGANFRVAWTQESLFQAAPGADAPITYNPMDDLDPATGLPYGFQQPGAKKNKKNKTRNNNSGNTNNEDGDEQLQSVEEQKQAEADAIARNYLDQLYGTAVSQD